MIDHLKGIRENLNRYIAGEILRKELASHILKKKKPCRFVLLSHFGLDCRTRAVRVHGHTPVMGAGLSARPLPVTPPEPSYDASLYDADAKWPGAASPRKDQNTTVSHPEPSGLVIVHDGAWETYREDFMIQLRGFAGFEFWQGVRSRDDFERLRSVFEQECGTPLVSMGPLPKRPEFIQMSPWKWACYLRETRSGLQRWLDAAISSRLCDNMLWRTLLSRALDVKVSQTCPDAWLDLAHAVLGLPTMMNIMSFLEEPKDVVRLCNLSAGWICHGTVPFCPKQWEAWPVLFCGSKLGVGTKETCKSFNAASRLCL